MFFTRDYHTEFLSPLSLNIPSLFSFGFYKKTRHVRYFQNCVSDFSPHSFCRIQLYGTETSDKYRPSASGSGQYDLQSVEADKRNRDLLKAGKVRDVLLCGECGKPRCVYAQLKLDRQQV